MKCAVFPCIGLGDGLITLVLSHNLKQAGAEVDTYHPFLSTLQPLFPHLPILERERSYAFLEKYDKLFILYEKLEWMQNLIKIALEKFPEKTVILNPIATPNQDYPYWEVGKFDGRIPFGQNLATYCQKSLQISQAKNANGICPPSFFERGKYKNRVIIHPTSSRKGKNWSEKKFLKLSRRLETQGLEPAFILSKEERIGWPEEINAPIFPSLLELAQYIAESGVMIGNDSGIGHLASNLGLPTLTICRSKMSADFWRPSWTVGGVVTAPSWIPNLKGLRWRDHKWQAFIGVSMVYQGFLKLYALSKQS